MLIPDIVTVVRTCDTDCTTADAAAFVKGLQQQPKMLEIGLKVLRSRYAKPAQVFSWDNDSVSLICFSASKSKVVIGWCEALPR